MIGEVGCGAVGVVGFLFFISIYCWSFKYYFNICIYYFNV